ncbi:uncharacterized protein LOC135396504 [Ornithodoros turicata]|uniref:uncharacterized protein LOC135396504 n=1 Tax=Ornithodoros turicata TaxID=34597 RepID=UPI003139DCF5
MSSHRMQQLIVVGLFLSLTSVLPVESKCEVKNAPNVSGWRFQRFPNILFYYKAGYKLSAEVNSGNATVVFTEYFSYNHNKGYLTSKQDNETVDAYYSGDTDEAFIFKGDACVTTKLDGAAPFLSGTKLLTFITPWRTYKIAGPSSLFVVAAIAFTQRRSNRPIYQGSGGDVRGIRTMRWDFCLNDDEPPYEFYFADPSWDNGYGNLMKPLPVRIKQGDEYTELMQVQPYNIDSNRVFQIPQSKGCARLFKSKEKPVTFGNITMSFHAELMFTNPVVNGPYHYISHLDIVNDPVSKHFSMTYSPWDTAAAPKSQLIPGEEYQEIFDTANGIKYHLQKQFPRCLISSEKTSRPTVQLPDNSSMAVLDFLLPTAQMLKDAVYLGRQNERGLGVHVFEVTRKGLYVNTVFLQQAVITYSYLADVGPGPLTQANLPVKVTVAAYTTETKLYYNLAMNIHHVDTNLRDLHERLNIVSCYSDEKTDYSWLQIAFTEQSRYPAFLAESAPQIKDKFQTEFLRITKLSPLRVPRVLVDFADSMVYVTVLLLERPLLGGDYKLKAGTGITRPDLSAGVMTLDDCFKECSSRDFEECSAVAYCGASCYATTAGDPDTMGVLKPSPDCNTYIKNERARRRKLPLLSEAIDDIKKAVLAGDFVLSLTLPSSWVATSNFVAVSVQDSEGQSGEVFSASAGVRRLHRRGPDVDGFVSSLGVKHKTSAPYVKALGRYPLGDCAEICRNRADCESFSSCLSTSECTISSVHSENRSQLVKDTRCAVFSKRYSDSFEAYEGMSLDMTADKSFVAGTVDDCARLCVSDKDVNCKSFDYCAKPRDPATKCRIHSTHLRDLVDPSQVDKSAVEGCIHFSRIFLSDFQKKAGVRSMRPTATTIQNLTAEECAKLCRESVFDCRSFDFCAGGPRGVGTCIQHQAGDGAFIDAPMCNSYIYVSDPDAAVLQFNNPNVTNGYSKGTAAGLAVLLLLIGIGLGVAALTAFNIYKRKLSSTS